MSKTKVSLDDVLATKYRGCPVCGADTEATVMITLRKGHRATAGQTKSRSRTFCAAHAVEHFEQLVSLS